jgi:hypothetical protein
MPKWVLTERWFCKVYGLKPWEVDELPIEDVIWWPVIEKAEADAERWKAKQERSRRRHGLCRLR